MSTLAFSIPGHAHGKGRPRATARGGFARLYTDAKTRAYETLVRTRAQTAMDGLAPLAGPLSVSLRIRIAIPVSFSKARRARILSGAEPYFGAYDVDNVAKSILDGMNGACFGDDRQIEELFVTRTPAERPGVDVRIQPAAREAA